MANALEGSTLLVAKIVCKSKSCRTTAIKDGYCKRHNSEYHLRKNNPERYKDYYLRSTYGISLEVYQKLLVEQGGVCAICGTLSGSKANGCKSLSVDHCHTTGVIRGLLCARCNRSIGELSDSPVLLRRAAEYLEKAQDSSLDPFGVEQTLKDLKNG